MTASRYSRQELFPGIGKRGQEKLRSSSVCIVGCGALGSLQAEALTRAGIGRLKIVDRDFVEMSNLQRQSLFTERDARESIPKAVAAGERLREINSEVAVETVVADFQAASASLVEGAALVLDGTDNFQARYLLNDVCWKWGVPWIYGACVGSTGVSAAFVPPAFPCLRCVFDSEPSPGSAPTCETAGILWPAVSAVAGYQVARALQILTGTVPEPEMLHLDAWRGTYRSISLTGAKRTDCPTCGLSLYPALNTPPESFSTMCGRDAIQIKPNHAATIDFDSMENRWRNLGPIFRNPFLLRLTVGDLEVVLFSDGRALVKGTADVTRARDIYAKYVGI